MAKYKPGQLITLKDGNVYRCTKRPSDITWTLGYPKSDCDYCRSFNTVTPCRANAFFVEKKSIYDNAFRCGQLFHRNSYPKITPYGKTT